MNINALFKNEKSIFSLILHWNNLKFAGVICIPVFFKVMIQFLNIVFITQFFSIFVFFSLVLHFRSISSQLLTLYSQYQKSHHHFEDYIHRKVSVKFHVDLMRNEGEDMFYILKKDILSKSRLKFFVIILVEIVWISQVLTELASLLALAVSVECLSRVKQLRTPCFVVEAVLFLLSQFTPNFSLSKQKKPVFLTPAA